MKQLSTTSVPRPRIRISRGKYSVSQFKWNKLVLMPSFCLPSTATLTRASYAYRGWGWSDWWSNRYVELNCDGSLTTSCAKGNVLAATSNNNKDFGYPLITFCDLYFSNLPSFDTVIKTLDSNTNQDLRLNVLNLRNQGKSRISGRWLRR